MNAGSALSPVRELSRRTRRASVGLLLPGFPRAKVIASSRQLLPRASEMRRRSACSVALSVEPSLNEAAQFLERQAYTEARAAYQVVLTLDPYHLDALYGKGICCLHLALYKQGLAALLHVERWKPEAKLYQYISACYRGLNNYPSAVEYLARGIKAFPDCIDNYLIRGTLLNEKDLWQAGAKDFSKILRTDPHNGAACLGLADSFAGLGNHEVSLTLLKQAADLPEWYELAMLRQAKILYSIDQHTQALEVLETLSSSGLMRSEGLYLQGMTFLKLQKYTEAALALEQSLKYESEYKSQCIRYLAIVQLKQSDYYGALHTFGRSAEEDPESRVLKLYAEGVVALMKTKYSDGIALLSKVVKDTFPPELKDGLAMAYMCRGYAQTALQQYRKALRSFALANAQGSLNRASEYNLLICNAVLAFQTPEAPRFLNEAAYLVPTNPDPLVFKACLLQNTDGQQAEEFLSEAISLKDTEAPLYFYRGIVRYRLGHFFAAGEDVGMAIDNADQAEASHYMLQGLCFAAVDDLEVAFKAFTLALHVKKDFLLLHFYRGRVAFLIGDHQLAYEDLQICRKTTNPQLLVKIGDLYVLVAAYQEALECYSKAYARKPHPRILVMKAKVYLLIGELDSLAKILTILAKSKKFRLYSYDLQVVRTLQHLANQEFKQARDAINNTEAGELYSNTYVQWTRGLVFYYLGLYHTALDTFTAVLEDVDLQEARSATTENEACEVLLNVALCEMHLNPLKSVQLLRDLADMLGEPQRLELLTLAALIHSYTGNSPELDYPAETVEFLEGIQSGELTKILPLSTGQTDYLPLVPLPQVSHVRVRPAITIPRVRFASVKFGVDNFAADLFSMLTIKPQPEAPWVVRVNGVVQFTDNCVSHGSRPTSG